MSEQTLIRINTNLCIDGKGCSDVVLNLTQAEVYKLYQLAPISKVEEVNYADYKGFWATSFSLTLSLWIFAYICGRVLRFLR